MKDLDNVLHSIKTNYTIIGKYNGMCIYQCGSADLRIVYHGGCPYCGSKRVGSVYVTKICWSYTRYECGTIAANDGRHTISLSEMTEKCAMIVSCINEGTEDII